MSVPGKEVPTPRPVADLVVVVQRAVAPGKVVLWVRR